MTQSFINQSSINIPLPLAIASGGTGQTSSTGTGVLVLGTAPTLNQPIIVGVTTNSDAAAGDLGEFISSVIPYASRILLSNLTPADVTTISLTAGDWDVWGNTYVIFGGNAVLAAGWCSLTSATTVDQSLWSETTNNGGAIATGGGAFTETFPMQRFSLAAPATIYLTAMGGFSTSTGAACGGIYARRVR